MHSSRPREEPEDAHAATTAPGRSRLLRNSRASLVAGIVLGAAALAALLTLIQVPLEHVPALLGIPAFLATVAWACYVRPRVELEPDALIIVNIARTTTIPFSCIDGIDLRLGLTVRSTGGKPYSAWALPSSGRRSIRRGRRGPRREPHVPEAIQVVLDAYARWQQAPEASESAGRSAVTSMVSAGPPVLIAVTALWAAWGLGTAAVL